MTFNGNWDKESGEARTEEYRAWRTRIGFGAVGDVDQIEYRATDGRPLLVVELCVADRRSKEHPYGVPDYAASPSPEFFVKVEEKVGQRRAQGRLVQHLGEQLDVPVLLVVYIKDELHNGVWVKRCGSTNRWQALTLQAYADNLRQWHARYRLEPTA